MWSNLRGIGILAVYVVNALFWGTLVLALGLCKLCLPRKQLHPLFARALTQIGFWWADVINWTHRFSPQMTWDVQLPANLQPQKSYLIVANHQSWADAFVLFKALNRKVTPPRYFIRPPKRWNVVFRAICWSLDFPIMQRYSKAYLAEHPELQGQDIATTRHFCAKFKDLPVVIINFVEGTRVTAEKQRRQQSPYLHLLKPRAGGMALILAELGQYLSGILNVTIVYPQASVRFWDYLCGRIPHIVLRSELLPITAPLQGDYLEDPAFQAMFQEWMNQLWREKDQRIARILNDPASSLT